MLKKKHQENKKPHMHKILENPKCSHRQKIDQKIDHRSAVAWGGSPVKGTRGVERIVKAHEEVLGRKGGEGAT